MANRYDTGGPRRSRPASPAASQGRRTSSASGAGAPRRASGPGGSYARYGTSGPSAGRGSNGLQRRRALIGGAILIAALLLIWLIKGSVRDASVGEAPAAPQAQTAEALSAGEAFEPTAPQPTPTPADPVMAQRAAAAPTPTAPGFLPVYRRGGTDERIIAITVDDCYQPENLRLIVDKAIECGAKLTIFPIGKNAIRENTAEALKYAWENGMELENHTYTHNGLYRCSDQELAEEIYKQQLVLSYILGVEYQPHFLRPMGGDAKNDQRLQKYAEQLGYYGIAHWSDSGRVSNASLVEALQPGAIFLFHTTDTDLDKLLKFIPYATEQGWQLVTLNEMFGLPENETDELIQPVLSRPVPTIAPYERVLVSYRKTSYAWGVYLLQQKLIELGYLSGEPDGVYGDDSESAVRAYQRDHGLEVTGVADVETQKMILEL